MPSSRAKKTAYPCGISATLSKSLHGSLHQGAPKRCHKRSPSCALAKSRPRWIVPKKPQRSRSLCSVHWTSLFHNPDFFEKDSLRVDLCSQLVGFPHSSPSDERNGETVAANGRISTRLSMRSKTRKIALVSDEEDTASISSRNSNGIGAPTTANFQSDSAETEHFVCWTPKPTVHSTFSPILRGRASNSSLQGAFVTFDRPIACNLYLPDSY